MSGIRWKRKAPGYYIAFTPRGLYLVRSQDTSVRGSFIWTVTFPHGSGREWRDTLAAAKALVEREATR